MNSRHTLNQHNLNNGMAASLIIFFLTKKMTFSWESAIESPRILQKPSRLNVRRDLAWTARTESKYPTGMIPLKVKTALRRHILKNPNRAMTALLTTTTEKKGLVIFC